MSRPAAFVAGGLVGTALTFLVMRAPPPAEADVRPEPQPQLAPDAGLTVSVVIPPRPVSAVQRRPVTAVVPASSAREQQVAEMAQGLQRCGEDVSVLTVATAALSISANGAVRASRVTVEPSSETVARCLRGALAELKVSEAAAPEQTLLRLRFEPR